ncbi:MAG: type II toxin-antitoxin system CcdA family antitoxin [Hydrogenothermaceae bacterium]|nr:type II toxin-antitoxin system CcdA family antitoxin [Hydrogenothermaceae bacterium]
MSVIKKTISLPEDIYREVASTSDNFSKVVKEALEEYLKKKKKEKLLTLAGKLKDWNIEDGVEFVSKLRKEKMDFQKDRRKFWDT